MTITPFYLVAEKALFVRVLVFHIEKYVLYFTCVILTDWNTVVIKSQQVWAHQLSGLASYPEHAWGTLGVAIFAISLPCKGRSCKLLLGGLRCVSSFPWPDRPIEWDHHLQGYPFSTKWELAQTCWFYSTLVLLCRLLETTPSSSESSWIIFLG